MREFKMSQENLKIWEAVCKTAPSQTKKVNQRGGYTAIDPTYQAMKATEQFGAYGTGWGLKESDFDYTLFDKTGMVIHKAIFFYVGGSFPITNAISVFSDKQQTRADEDFAKKVETNTISKALSRLGFSADVFMGLFDNNEYVNAQKQKEQIETSIDQVEGYEKAVADFESWVKQQLSLYPLTPTARALESLHNASKHKLMTRMSGIQGLDVQHWQKTYDAAYAKALQLINDKKTK